MKKLIITITILISLVAIIFLIITQIISSDLSKWANYTSIGFNLAYAPDSVKLKICDEITTFNNVSCDSLSPNHCSVYDNFNTPENGYPCKVEILVYNDGKYESFIAEPFNCNHCDIEHNYDVFPDSVNYSVK